MPTNDTESNFRCRRWSHATPEEIGDNLFAVGCCLMCSFENICKPMLVVFMRSWCEDLIFLSRFEADFVIVFASRNFQSEAS